METFLVIWAPLLLYLTLPASAQLIEKMLLILLADKSCVCYIFISFSLFKAYYSFNWYLIFNTSRENFLLPPLFGFGFFFCSISLKHDKISFTQQSLFDYLPCARNEKWHSTFKNLRQNIQFFEF